MTYQAKTKAAVKAAPNSLGKRLAKLAIKHDFSVQKIAKTTGASRVTVYHWFLGGTVTNAYQAAVNKLVLRLKKK